jgi:DNA polymerase
MANAHRKALESALEWYIEQGVDEALSGASINRFAAKTAEKSPPLKTAAPAPESADPVLFARSDARSEAIKRAAAATTLEELREAIAAFDGLAIRKTATNMVFADGHPQASIMLVGEAPGADEDRLGKPFVGVSGQLLDRILGCIDLDRKATDIKGSVYISNILNWRPPGNRTPSPAEIEISLPFIERHIQLVRPKILILCGSVAAKSLLGRDEGISRLRKTWHDYMPQTREFSAQAAPIAAIATYHPAYLLRTPGQKKAVWADMLAIKQRIDNNQ